MSKHTLVDTTEPQTFYVTDATWAYHAGKPRFKIRNDTFHLGEQQIHTSFDTDRLELQPATLKTDDAYGNFRITGSLSKAQMNAIFFIKKIELLKGN